MAASAAMVLGYMRFAYSYKRLIRLLRIQWFGAPSFNIRHLTKLGLTVIYKQGTLAELHHHLTQNRPPIVFAPTGHDIKTRELPYWHLDTDHALVVVGIDDQYIYLNDPDFDTAPMQVSLGDFDLAWFEHEERYAVLMR
jgi:ABC-type bacteriocin/lantibiotic exporter with double-glycine peptidase domain